MHFFRLLKPLWGQKYLYAKEKKEKNPDCLQAIDGPNTIEGAFELDYVGERNIAGYNIYWFPNHPSTNVYSPEKHYLNGRDIDTFEWIFIDMDLKDGIYATQEVFFEELKKFSIVPTMTVVSGHGVHAYWRITDLDRTSYLVLQMMLIQHFKTDDSIWTVLQLMRWPGSVNTKVHGEYRETYSVPEISSGGEYQVQDLFTVLPEITEKNFGKVQSHMDKLDGKITINIGADVNLEELPDKFITLMETDEEVAFLFNDPDKARGDRSKADAALANHLFTRNFNRKEALHVLMNTQKALSKGASRFNYAMGTVDFVYNDRVVNKFQTVGERLKGGRKEIRGDKVRGPYFFDCLQRGWRKGNVLGMIAGPSTGKTTVALKIFKEMIGNNPENDDIFVFFSLEMPEYEIDERWVNLTRDNPKLADRLYVIGNEDDNGEPRNLSLQDMYAYCQDLRRDTGKNIASVVIDHKDIINPVINIKIKPTFGAEGEQFGGRGNMRTLSPPNLCKAMKPLAKMLDTFLILLTQTTKGKGGGDTPIGVDGAFGTAAYEWMMDYVISIWQPLMRVQKDTDLRILGWQYAKIRSKHKDDGVAAYEQCMLKYEMDSGDLLPLTRAEQDEFEELLPLANDARKAVDKKEGGSYRNSLTSKEVDNLRKKIYG